MGGGYLGTGRCLEEKQQLLQYEYDCDQLLSLLPQTNRFQPRRQLAAFCCLPFLQIVVNFVLAAKLLYTANVVFVCRVLCQCVCSATVFTHRLWRLMSFSCHVIHYFYDLPPSVSVYLAAINLRDIQLPLLVFHPT